MQISHTQPHQLKWVGPENEVTTKVHAISESLYSTKYDLLLLLANKNHLNTAAAAAELKKKNLM
jgi:hypothetical protein